MSINKNHSSDNIPQLRFPEFQGDWENKKLGEVSEINPTNKNLPDKFIYIDLESVSNGELLKENEITIENAPSRAQRILQPNDVLFQMVRPYQKNNLFFDKKGTYVASTGYAQIRTEQNPKYLFQYLHFQTFVDRVIERCTGTSYPSINSTDLSNIEFSYPSIEEQTKIASFLSVVDEKIQALKKKHSLLEQYKKGVMQKIFSQELRFKDENGNDFPEWEESKLGDLAEITIGEFVIKTKQNPYAKYPVYNGGKSYTGFYDEYNNEGNKIIISARGANAGFVNFAVGRYWAGNSCYSIGISDKTKYDILYFYHYVKMYESRFLQNQQAANIPSVSKKDAENFIIQIPSISEQNKISIYLSAIDEKTKNILFQIEKLDIWKNGLMQKMFC